MCTDLLMLVVDVVYGERIIVIVKDRKP